MRGQVLGAVPELEPVAVDEGLHAAQVGERRQHRHLDRAEVVLAVLQGPVELLHEVGGLEVVEVHLPVARHERDALACLGSHGCRVVQCLVEDGEAGQLLALEVLQAGAATGGDVAELVVGEAELAHGRGRVAAADDGQRTLRGDLDERLRRAAAVPAAYGAISNAPIGPFQNTVRQSASFSANSCAGLGPDVQAHPVGRDRVGRDDLVVGVGRELGGRDDVDGQHDLDAALLGLRRGSPCTASTWSASSRLLPTSWPWAARKVKTMPPPMSRRSAVCSRLSMTAELVGRPWRRRAPRRTGARGPR